MSSPRNITTSSENAPNASIVSSIMAIISLGSNLPFANLPPEEIVLAAVERLRAISLDVSVSSLYLTEALDCPTGTADFVNAAMVLQLAPEWSAHQLLSSLQEIEADFGRQRTAQRNQARTLDIDLISFENQMLAEERLSLPHPRAMQRRFVLMPLAEIIPNLVLPGQSLTVLQALHQLPNHERLQLFSR